MPQASLISSLDRHKINLIQCPGISWALFFGEIMIKQKVSIERQINERHYQFLVSVDAPLVEIISILEDIKSEMTGRLEASVKEEESKDG
jgi:hypothetical protein